MFSTEDNKQGKDKGKGKGRGKGKGKVFGKWRLENVFVENLLYFFVFVHNFLL